MITTTPVLGNTEIQRYIGPLTAHVVLGINFFSDFAASLTDIFGGKSETYQSKLETLTYEVDQLMRAKASRMGANALIDYKLQFNEISGKEKQMFMVTATGTACVINAPKHKPVTEVGLISYSQIRRQYLITLYREWLKNKKPLSNKDWENIYSLDMTELAPELTDEYFRLKAGSYDNFELSEYQDSFPPKYEEYLTRLNKDEASRCIFPYLEIHPVLVINLAISNNLFDPKVVIEQITAGNVSVAADLLRSHKDYYTKDDLAEMKQIISLFDSLPDKGSIQVVRSGRFTKKEEEMYICPDGHKNPKELRYCDKCGQNTKGLTLEQVKVINQFKRVTEALEAVI